MQISLKSYHNLYLIILLLFAGCGGCSKSGRFKNANNSNKKNDSHQNRIYKGEKTVVQMEKVNGVFQIPVEVDGVKMFFIFDTGASSISISETEANFLYKQGLLTNEDIIGKVNFLDATGDISEGTVIVLKTVKIGNIVLDNIEASVVHNQNAPLLFGQSALKNFGKISIDNKRGEITFE
jgi:aspartyl protease family protein